MRYPQFELVKGLLWVDCRPASKNVNQLYNNLSNDTNTSTFNLCKQASIEFRNDNACCPSTPKSMPIFGATTVVAQRLVVACSFSEYLDVCNTK
jgi:hypothetical protein